MTISTPNTLIDGKDIRGCVDIRAAGVVIRNSKIVCTGFYVVASFAKSYSGTGLVVEDSEISCGDTRGTALGDTNITARGVDIHGCENGFDIDGNVTVKDSWIHDLFNTSQSHTDGIQLAANDGHNVLVNHNNIDGGIGTSAMIMNTTDANGVTVSDNLLAGGAATLYCPPGTGVNVKVVNNRFVRTAAYMPWTDCKDEAVVTGNVWDDSEKPLPF
jgi:hypothetical protein